MRFRGSRARIVYTYGLSQGVVFAASAARITVLISAVGAAGYGLVTAVGAVAPWLLLPSISVTNIARTRYSELQGHQDREAALLTGLVVGTRRFGLTVGVLGVLLAMLVPWHSVLDTHDVSTTQVRLALALTGILAGTSVPGAAYLGLLQARGRVAVTSTFPAIAAVVSLAGTAVSRALHLPFTSYVLASTFAACGPYWIAHVTFRRANEVDRASIISTLSSEPLSPGRVFYMTGASAPPLLSTGLDPLVLASASNPAAAAGYSLATRLGLLITLVPAALYPTIWSEIAALRGAGQASALLAALRANLLTVGGLTGIMAGLYLLVAPTATRLLSREQIAFSWPLALAVVAAALISTAQTLVLPLVHGRSAAPFVAAAVYALVLPNLALSYLLASALGAPGPLAASVAVGAMLLAWCGWLIRRRPHFLVRT